MIPRQVAFTLFSLCGVAGAAAGLVICGLADNAAERMSMFVGFAMIVIIGAIALGGERP